MKCVGGPYDGKYWQLAPGQTELLVYEAPDFRPWNVHAADPSAPLPIREGRYEKHPYYPLLMWQGWR